MMYRRTCLVLFAAALIGVTLQSSPKRQEVDIVYKYTDAYEQIWNNFGDGADMGIVVLWRVKNYQSEFCSLGDVATRVDLATGWKDPPTKAVLVSQKKSGALVHPTSFSLVWKDSGSGADLDGAIYKMNAPSGYTCLGGVAVNSHYYKPDSNKYCCVKNEYVVQADTMFTWNDAGSGADTDVSLWTVIRAGGDASGLDASNFIGNSAHSKPKSSAAYLLKADGSKVRDIWSLPKGKGKPLNLYEVGELKNIWDDSGSGADVDCSIWRAESRDGYYPVGDIVVATWAKPKIGFLLRPTDANDDSIRVPVDYKPIWRDTGSGADRDVTLWKVVCPAGYVSLGNVATDGSRPNIGAVYCVKHSYTTYGSTSNWKQVWTDAGSGANADAKVYEARTLSYDKSVQSVRGFGAVNSGIPRPPYLLKKEFLTYWAEKPIAKIIMYNVKYNLNQEKQQTSPVKMSPTIVENHSSQAQSVSRTLSYSVAESSTFSFSQAIQLGVSVAVEGGLPLIGSAKTTVSASTTSTFSTGDTTTKTHTDSIRADIKLPGNSKINAVITGTEYKADIPYTATIKKIYFDGSKAYAQITGVYKGVAVSEIKIIYGEIEKFEKQADSPLDDQEIKKVEENEAQADSPVKHLADQEVKKVEENKAQSDSPLKHLDDQEIKKVEETEAQADSPLKHLDDQESKKVEEIETQADSPITHLGDKEIKEIEKIKDILKDILDGQ